MIVAERMIINWMYDHTRFNRIINKMTRYKVGVTSIGYKVGDILSYEIGHVRQG